MPFSSVDVEKKRNDIIQILRHCYDVPSVSTKQKNIRFEFPTTIFLVLNLNDGQETAMLVPCIFSPRIACDRVNVLGENRTQKK